MTPERIKAALSKRVSPAGVAITIPPAWQLHIWFPWDEGKSAAQSIKYGNEATGRPPLINAVTEE